MIPTVTANGSPAFGQYKPSETGDGYDPWALQVLEIDDGRIVEFTFFLDTETHLPAVRPAAAARRLARRTGSRSPATRVALGGRPQHVVEPRTLSESSSRPRATTPGMRRVVRRAPGGRARRRRPRRRDARARSRSSAGALRYQAAHSVRANSPAGRRAERAANRQADDALRRGGHRSRPDLRPRPSRLGYRASARASSRCPAVALLAHAAGVRLAGERQRQQERGGHAARSADHERQVIAVSQRDRRSACRRARGRSLRVAETVASTARPSAPPTCADVLTRPEARPASSGADARHGERHQRGERRADADAQQQHDRQDVAQVAAVHRTRENSARPIATSSMPGSSVRRAPKRMISRSE